MTTPSLDARNLALIEANGFDPGALEANRAGQLTPAQIAGLRSKRGARGAALLVIGALFVTLGGWNLYTSEDDRWGAAMAVVLGVILIALRWSNFAESYATALAAGRTASIDGLIVISSTTGDGHTMYFYRLGEREFQTTEEGAKAIEPKGRYRVYYLANSDQMVNIEVLGSPRS